MTNKEYSENLKNVILSILDEEKAEDIVSVDLAGKTDIADYMIVASGLNKRHVASLAEKIQLVFKNDFNKLVEVEGLENSEWVLIDCLDVIVHVFQPHVREYYNLEQLWKIPLIRDED